ncbi:hypothetical protein [Comamonas sp. NoAH]|uniref:hypothetical protein n=1 Tax=Comamonas halotolerans TaxID=3041496 RepID=UPI0024E0CEC9|nr:hypothetical protein [Comamonas sp. NoAH]
MATSQPKKPAVDSTNEYLGASNTMEFGVVPDFTSEIIDNPIPDMASAEYEAFMNEPVMVTVMSSGKDNEHMFVQVAVNGVIQMFKRDVPIVVKRKYVERLARAKETGYEQTLDDRLGEAMNRLTSHHSLRYPFQVNRDDNPRGAAWLRSVLAS